MHFHIHFSQRLGTGHYLSGGGGGGANRGWATIFYAWLKGGPLKNMQTFCQQKCYKLHLDAISKYSLLK